MLIMRMVSRKHMEVGYSVFPLVPSVHLTPFTESLLPAGLYCYCLLHYVLVQCTNEGKARATTLLSPSYLSEELPVMACLGVLHEEEGVQE